MLSIKSTQTGDFDFSTRRLEENEKKLYGIFISHASVDNDEYLFPLRNAMKERELHPLCDRDFLSGGDEFQMKIEKTLDCYAAVIIVTEASLRSNWVNYEIGFLSGRGIKIYLWDPTGLFLPANHGANPEIDAFKLSHIGKFFPVYHTMDELLSALSGASPYSEMFCEENVLIDTETFGKRVSERVETIIATIESEIFDIYYSDFKECRFGVLVPHFGMFFDDHGDGEHCYAKRCTPIENNTCPISGKRCALSPKLELDEENKECVILNHTLFTGTVLRKNDIDRCGRPVKCGSVIFHLPLHKYYGTMFKFIIDVADNNRYNRLMSILTKAGMNPTSSESKVGGRIYLSLPERRAQGLFRLENEFADNFFCPYAAK